MEDKLQLRVQRYGWDAAAPVYEDTWRASLAHAQSALLEMADLAPGHSVVETAAGTGLVSLEIARAVLPDGHVIGKTLAHYQELAGFNTSLTKSQFGTMPLDQARANTAALAQEILPHFQDPPAAAAD